MENSRKNAMSPESLKRFRAYQREFNKETYVQIAVKFNKITDADVIAMIYSQPNSIDYLRQLIKKDIAEKEIDIDALIEEQKEKRLNKSQSKR